MSLTKVRDAQSCLTLCDPKDYTAHGILQTRILEWVAFPFSRGSSQLRNKPRSPTLQVDSLLAEPQGKPKSTGVGSLSLLQWIFPIQESDWGLLHCRQTLCQLSYQGSLTKQAGASSCFVIVWHWVDSGWDVIFSILRQSLRAMVERKEWVSERSRSVVSDSLRPHGQ